MKEDLLIFRRQSIVYVRMVNKDIHAARGKAKQEALESDRFGRFVNWRIRKPLLIDLYISRRFTKDGLHDVIAGLNRATDSFTCNAEFTEQSIGVIFQRLLPSAQGL